MAFARQFIFVFIAIIGFAGYFNVKKKSTLIASALSGGISFAIFNIFIMNGQSVLGTFIAALLVGVIGELLSVRFKTPSTVFIMPAIIPLVPGSGMYYTMLHFVHEDFTQMIAFGTQTIFVAGSIAMGILVGSIFSRSLKRMRRSNIK